MDQQNVQTNKPHKQKYLTFDHKVLWDPLPPGDPVAGYVLDALLEHGPDPDTDVGGHDVHEPEPGQALELVDVQLKRELSIGKVFRHFFKSFLQDSRLKILSKVWNIYFYFS